MRWVWQGGWADLTHCIFDFDLLASSCRPALFGRKGTKVETRYCGKCWHNYVYRSVCIWQLGLFCFSQMLAVPWSKVANLCGSAKGSQLIRVKRKAWQRIRMSMRSASIQIILRQNLFATVYFAGIFVCYTNKQPSIRLFICVLNTIFALNTHRVQLHAWFERHFMERPASESNTNMLNYVCSTQPETHRTQYSSKRPANIFSNDIRQFGKVIFQRNIH